MTEKEMILAAPLPPPEFLEQKKGFLARLFLKKDLEKPKVEAPIQPVAEPEIPPELQPYMSSEPRTFVPVISEPQEQKKETPPDVIPPPVEKKKSLLRFLKKKEVPKTKLPEIQAPEEPKKLELKLEDLKKPKKVKAPPKPGFTDNLKKEQENTKVFEKQMSKVNSDLDRINRELSLKKK